jgi:hypothetical protein
MPDRMVIAYEDATGVLKPLTVGNADGAALPVADSMPGLFNATTLTSGTAVVVPMKSAPRPATVWARPVAGDTVTVSYSTDNQANWITWPNGAVTAYSQDVLLSGITHLRFQRTAGSGTTSTCGVC